MVVTTTDRRDMLTVTRASLLSLRAALLRSGDPQSAVTLQEAGYAGGAALYESFKGWLAERSEIGIEDLDVEAAPAVAPQHERRLRIRLVNDLKLLFAALGAGGSVVPLGDNGRTTRFLSQYAESLRDH